MHRCAVAKLVRARRGVPARVAVLLAALAGSSLCAAPARADMLSSIAGSLIDRHVEPKTGGWAWQSVIQPHHLQVDRDVGTASVGIGFLAAYDVEHDQGYLSAAESAGDWLIGVAQPAKGGGVEWPDWDDGNGSVHNIHYHSYDDGAPGIADFLWRLSVESGITKYADEAKLAMEWEEHEAKAPPGQSCPGTQCYWTWAHEKSVQYTGMGEGVAGIAYAFDAFAQETGDPSYEQYALAAAAWLEAHISAQGAIPEVASGHAFDTGYLSGSAGDAFLFARLAQSTGDQRWLNDAKTLETWVSGQGISVYGGTAWPIETPGDKAEATGIEEGAAGIGWVELQLYALTTNPHYLNVAVQAGTWLRAVAIPDDYGVCWLEDINGKNLVHTSLDNGAPGIGWFLFDLAEVDPYNGGADSQAATDALTWLQNVAFQDGDGIYWYEHFKGKPSKPAWSIPADPSWHWGLAGIAGYTARYNGWSIDMPGEQPGL
jgi:uncharacterized protein YyaL (SSP411 family)